MIDHSACDFAYKLVRCDQCGREYVCVPYDDYYCMPEGGHACEWCMLGPLWLAAVVIPGEPGAPQPVLWEQDASGGAVIPP